MESELVGRCSAQNVLPGSLCCFVKALNSGPGGFRLVLSAWLIVDARFFVVVNFTV